MKYLKQASNWWVKQVPKLIKLQIFNFIFAIAIYTGLILSAGLGGKEFIWSLLGGFVISLVLVSTYYFDPDPHNKSKRAYVKILTIQTHVLLFSFTISPIIILIIQKKLNVGSLLAVGIFTFLATKSGEKIFEFVLEKAAIKDYEKNGMF